MKQIQQKHVNLAFGVLIACAVLLIVGFILSWLVIPGLACIVAYYFIDRFLLRCPHCGAFIDIRTLRAASRSRKTCKDCGQVIKIAK